MPPEPVDEKVESDARDVPAFLADWSESPTLQAVDKEDPPDASAALPVVEDDASRYLLDSTSPASLPPPGLEAVFEATMIKAGLASSSAYSAEGRKLTREERIKATRAARQAVAANKRIRGNSDVENHAMGGAVPAKLKAEAMGTGDMVNELKNVIGELRRRKETVLGSSAGRANAV
jgi:hypothetical protein